MKKISAFHKMRLPEKVSLRNMFLLITFTVALVFAVFHLEQCFEIVKWFYRVLSPFINGIVIAYLLNILLRLFEDKLFSGMKDGTHKIWDKSGRVICIFLSVLTVCGVLVLIGFLVIPQLVSSVSSLRDLAEEVPDYLDRFTAWVSRVLQENGLLEEQIQRIELDWGKLVEGLLSLLTGGGKSLLSLTVNVTSGIFNLLVSFVFSLYLLAGKETLLLNCRRLLFAYLPQRAAKSILRTSSLANRIFTGYVSGQFTEALILATLCYIGMMILRIPYPLLVGVVVGLTSLIPVFGAYIGAAIGALVILIVDPLSSLWFLVFLILLQNLESNLIYPRVVGSSVGLPAIWVMAAIIIFGSMFGFAGILAGVPVFSVLYTILRKNTRQRLKRRGIGDEVVEQSFRSEVLEGELIFEEEQVATNEELNVKEDDRPSNK